MLEKLGARIGRIEARGAREQGRERTESSCWKSQGDWYWRYQIIASSKVLFRSFPEAATILENLQKILQTISGKVGYGEKKKKTAVKPQSIFHLPKYVATNISEKKKLLPIHFHLLTLWKAFLIGKL